jgi:hypothetical protein
MEEKKYIIELTKAGTRNEYKISTGSKLVQVTWQ